MRGASVRVRHTDSWCLFNVDFILDILCRRCMPCGVHLWVLVGTGVRRDGPDQRSGVPTYVLT